MIKEERFDLRNFMNIFEESVQGRGPIIPKHRFVAETEVDLMGAVHQIYETISKSRISPNRMWYRGHKNKDYVLLPTLIREHYRRYKKDKDSSFSLAEYQRSLMESFVSRGATAIELIEPTVKINNSEIELLAQMQHYGVATNLLDWTEDLFTALYFACEDCFIGSDMPKQAATIYAFDPYLYNGIRAAIIKERYKDLHFSTESERRNVESTRPMGNIIPNFSLLHNTLDNRYQDFIRGEQYSSTNYSTPDNTRGGASIQPPATFLPLAIQVSRTSQRIQRQAGSFVAFNLSDTPHPGEDRYMGFQHAELEKIQEYYLNEFTGEVRIQNMHLKEKTPFLYRIDLEKESLGEFKELILAIGVRTYKLYPELENIGRDIMKMERGIY